MKHYYGIDLVDVVEGRGPAPFFVVPLVAGLPDTSMTAALRRGGLHYLGWGEDREIASMTFDALNLNTEATGQWRKKPPELPRWQRPKPPVADKKRSVADLFKTFNT